MEISEPLLSLSQESEDDSTRTPDDSDEEESIIVTRPEDERDPEADAEFDRELAKMMAESVESRKTERRPTLDVALPMRRPQRDTVTPAEDASLDASTLSPNTTRFALLSKRGNKPLVFKLLTLDFSLKDADNRLLLDTRP